MAHRYPLEVPTVKCKELTERSAGETSDAIRARVDAARRLQLERFRGGTYYCNAQMTARDLRAHCQVESAGKRLLELAINRRGLNARAYNRILKVARTIAAFSGPRRPLASMPSLAAVSLISDD
jgi:magnesium chelatase family protein